MVFRVGETIGFKKVSVSRRRDAHFCIVGCFRGTAENIYGTSHSLDDSDAIELDSVHVRFGSVRLGFRFGSGSVLFGFGSDSGEAGIFRFGNHSASG